MAGWLSRSAWSLALVGTWRQPTGGEPITVWVPDYFCNESLEPLRACGVRCVFYPISEDLSPDLGACRTMADEGSTPDVFVLVHYLGQVVPAAPARDFCVQQGAWLVEDAAHILIPSKGVGSWGDFVLHSPHKHLPVPDGALLVARTNGASSLGQDGIEKLGQPEGWAGQLQNLARSMEVHDPGRHASVWLLKRTLQKLGFSGPAPVAHAPFDEPRNRAAQKAEPLIPPAMSPMARRLLPSLIDDLPAIARARQLRARLWDTLVEADPEAASAGCTLVWPGVELDRTPYLRAFRARAPGPQTLHQGWLAKGLPVSSWPDLPPEVCREPEKHEVACRLRRERLYLSVQHTLPLEEMVRALGGTARAVATGALGPVPEWDGVDQKTWSTLLARADRSNPLQSWAYGEAKREVEGWRVRRAVFHRGAEPVALVQVLQKRVGGLPLVTRINRGPVFLPAATDGDRVACWREIGGLGNLRRLRVLLMAPEADATGRALRDLSELGFRPRGTDAWSSIWIDLTQEVDELRRQLNGKWRNMLVSSEKAGLSLSAERTAEACSWIVSEYESLREARGFPGPAPELLRAWWRCGADEAPWTILRAYADGEPVAGVCLAHHGSAATYLLGWNGERARELRASHFLLWNAVVYLKQAGLRGFDLGGIDDVATPGIAMFKRGMGGERYDLVGEFRRW